MQGRISSGMKRIQAMPLPLGSSALSHAQIKKEKIEKIHEGHRKAHIVSAPPSYKRGWPRAGFQTYKYRYFLCLPDPDTFGVEVHAQKRCPNIELSRKKRRKTNDNDFVP